MLFVQRATDVHTARKEAEPCIVCLASEETQDPVPHSISTLPPKGSSLHVDIMFISDRPGKKTPWLLAVEVVTSVVAVHRLSNRTKGVLGAALLTIAKEFVLRSRTLLHPWDRLHCCTSRAPRSISRTSYSRN